MGQRSSILWQSTTPQRTDHEEGRFKQQGAVVQRCVLHVGLGRGRRWPVREGGGGAVAARAPRQGTHLPRDHDPPVLVSGSCSVPGTEVCSGLGLHTRLDSFICQTYCFRSVFLAENQRFESRVLTLLRVCGAVGDDSAGGQVCYDNRVAQTIERGKVLLARATSPAACKFTLDSWWGAYRVRV